MSTLQKLSELEQRRLSIQNSCNDKSKQELIAKDKLSARERIAQLFDPYSFVEIGAFIKSRSTAFSMEGYETPADGVVCGYGTVEGVLVYAYSQDVSVLNGALGEMHAKKIVRVYEEALKVGAPIVAFLDTAGMRLEESIDALEGYGTIYTQCVAASGVIPQIAVICGDCGGATSFISGMADFVFASSKNGKLFLNSPHCMEGDVDFDALMSADTHLIHSGLIHDASEKEDQLIKEVKELITYLPSNSAIDTPCYVCSDELNRMDVSLNTFDFATQEIGEIVTSIADEGQVYLLGKSYAKDVLTSFIRLNGTTIGVVANQSEYLDYQGIKKITDFVSKCDAFNVPILTLTNVLAIASSEVTEKLGVTKEVTKMITTFIKASVPKVNVILKEAYGSGYIAMNSKHIGADYVYAWPSATIASMKKESAVKIMYEQEINGADDPQAVLATKQQIFEAQNNSYAIAARGYIDDIIEPAATRKRVIAAFEVLATKNKGPIYKKHPTI